MPENIMNYNVELMGMSGIHVILSENKLKLTEFLYNLTSILASDFIGDVTYINYDPFSHQHMVNHNNLINILTPIGLGYTELDNLFADMLLSDEHCEKTDQVLVLNLCTIENIAEILKMYKGIMESRNMKVILSVELSKPAIMGSIPIRPKKFRPILGVGEKFTGNSEFMHIAKSVTRMGRNVDFGDTLTFIKNKGNVSNVEYIVDIYNYTGIVEMVPEVLESKNDDDPEFVIIISDDSDTDYKFYGEGYIHPQLFPTVFRNRRAAEVAIRTEGYLKSVDCCISERTCNYLIRNVSMSEDGYFCGEVDQDNNMMITGDIKDVALYDTETQCKKIIIEFNNGSNFEFVKFGIREFCEIMKDVPVN